MEGASMTEKKNTFSLKYCDAELTFSGNFDSGNLNWAAVDYERNEVQLQFGKDKDIKPSSKCWFHFSVSGQYEYLPVKLNFQKVNSLSMVAKIYDLYRPVVKVEDGHWDRHPYPIEFEIGPENDVGFRMTLELYGSKTFYVALCYPWSVADNDKYLSNLEKSLQKQKQIYFNMETLILSPQNRPVHLIAISSGEVKQNQDEQYIEHLFPFKEESHMKAIKKPLILVTCRVHPSQIGSSYSLMGMINFLTSNSLEARKILSEFYFLIIPILNPDGVYNGNNRMDALGQNLNRFYLFPELETQPSCYAVKSLLENTRHQLFAFFDLHGHANKKSCFLFGNAISNQRLQIQSVLFAKYLSKICEYVEFKSCNFSKKQMSSKDKNDDFSKEGCARVVVHKWTNSPYCYTLETGLFKNVKVDDKGIERYGEQFYSPKIYAEVGAKMIISLYAILKKDKQIELMRKEVALYVQKLDKISKKAKDKVIKKEINTMKNVSGPKKQDSPCVETVGKASSVKQLSMKRAQSEKQNGRRQLEKQKDKAQGIQEILHRNKNYLLSLEAQEDD